MLKMHLPLNCIVKWIVVVFCLLYVLLKLLILDYRWEHHDSVFWALFYFPTKSPAENEFSAGDLVGRTISQEMFPFCQFIRTRSYIIVLSQMSKNSSQDLTLLPMPNMVKIALTISTGNDWDHDSIKAWNYKASIRLSCGGDEFIEEFTNSSKLIALTPTWWSRLS